MLTLSFILSIKYNVILIILYKINIFNGIVRSVQDEIYIKTYQTIFYFCMILKGAYVHKIIET